MTDEPTPKGERILVVDDDEFVCNSLKWLLMDEGYEVEVAPDGRTALQMVSRQPFDLVLTDLMMPEVDGLAVLKEVRRMVPNTAVIILTGYGTLEAAMSALKDGAYDFLTKPCDDGEMKYKIQGALKQKRLKERLDTLEDTVERIETAGELMKKYARHLDKEIGRAVELSGEELKRSLQSLKTEFDELRETLGPLGEGSGS